MPKDNPDTRFPIPTHCETTPPRRHHRSSLYGRSSGTLFNATFRHRLYCCCCCFGRFQGTFHALVSCMSLIYWESAVSRLFIRHAWFLYWRTTGCLRRLEIRICSTLGAPDFDRHECGGFDTNEGNMKRIIKKCITNNMYKYNVKI